MRVRPETQTQRGISSSNEELAGTRLLSATKQTHTHTQRAYTKHKEAKGASTSRWGRGYHLKCAVTGGAKATKPHALTLMPTLRVEIEIEIEIAIAIGEWHKFSMGRRTYLQQHLLSLVYFLYPSLSVSLSHFFPQSP